MTNDKLFEEPVFNDSRVFPFLWEEIRVPISFSSDRERAEKILLDCAANATADVHEASREQVAELQRRFAIDIEETAPRVFYRITDNWLELTVRFVVPTHGVRALKDALSRAILRGFDEAGIGALRETC